MTDSDLVLAAHDQANLAGQTTSAADPAQPPRDSAREYVVCREDELPPGSSVIAPVGKFGIGVYNIAGTLHAITNYCPHMGGPLCVGIVQGTNLWNDEEHGVEYALDGCVVRCPWHAWEFDITAGHAVADATKKIRRYEVRVEDGKVILKR